MSYNNTENNQTITRVYLVYKLFVKYTLPISIQKHKI